MPWLQRRSLEIALSDHQNRFTGAHNLAGNPALPLTEAADSPLYRLGVCVALDGAFGGMMKQNAISASLMVGFELARDGADREGA